MLTAAFTYQACHGQLALDSLEYQRVKFQLLFTAYVTANYCETNAARVPALSYASANWASRGGSRCSGVGTVALAVLGFSFTSSHFSHEVSVVKRTAIYKIFFIIVIFRI